MFAYQFSNITLANKGRKAATNAIDHSTKAIAIKSRCGEVDNVKI